MAITTVGTLTGYYKNIYGDKGPLPLIPEANKVQQLIKFAPRSKQLGNSYNQPVRPNRNAGFTYLAPAAGEVTLNDVISFVTQNATVVGSQVIGRSAIDYEATARAETSQAAFGEIYGYSWEQLQIDHRYRNELELLYGQSGLSTVGATAVGNVVTFSAATWATGIFNGAEGSRVQFFNAAGSTERTAGKECFIASIDPEAYSITFTYSSGTLQADGVVATDVLYFYGQRTTSASSSMIGLHKILTNTSTTLFGISPTAYSLWKATQYSAGTASLTQAKINAVIARAVMRGLEGSVDVLLNPKTWGLLLDNQSSLRRFVEKTSGGKAGGFENGAEAITFYSQNGKVSLHAHPYMWEGVAMGIVAEDFLRVGAVDFTTRIPGNDQIIFHRENKNSYEIRSYSNQAILPVKLGASFIVTDIVS